MFYLYDNTYEGFLSAVFDVFDARDRDALIRSEARHVNATLYGVRRVASDAEKARRVTAGVLRLRRDFPHELYKVWLSELDDADDTALAVLRLGFARKRDPLPMLPLDCVHRFRTIARRVGREVERFLQFVRFVKLKDDLYAADIEPEYNVLPLIARHFHERFRSQRFVIRDLRRRRALVSSLGGFFFAPLPAENPPLPKDGEFERMWRLYFDTIAIEQRINPKLQQHFVPKRYRAHLTEFQP